MQLLTCRTSLDALESTYGVCYSVLTDLPLFEPIRFPVIDPMHNLLLGTSKHVMNLWINKKIVDATGPTNNRGKM